jgi:hypothetical protein
MHNCKATKEHMTQLLLTRAETYAEPEMNCEACLEEFNALKNTLRITAQVLGSQAPDETYWHGYHQRLQQKLDQLNSPRKDSIGPTIFSRLFTASINVPVPIAVALVLAVAGVMLVVSRHPSKSETLPALSAVHERTEIPVVQEKIVTRVVYRESKRRSRQRNIPANPNSLVLAASQKKRAPSLIGFKPLGDLRFTLIKGGGTPDAK